MSSSVVMREQYIAPKTAMQKTDAKITELKQCACCPYGYHIDLDFVNYCEKLAAAARPQSDEQRQRREKRRQRKSMEVMLGVGEQLLQNYNNNHHHQQQQQQARNKCIPVVVEANENDSPARHTDRSPYEEFFNSHELKQFEYATTTTSTTTAFESHEKNEFVKDILFDVCSDFDRTFERTKKRHHHDINERNNYASLTKQTEIYGKCIPRNQRNVAVPHADVDEQKPVKLKKNGIEPNSQVDAVLRDPTERHHDIFVSLNANKSESLTTPGVTQAQTQLQTVQDELARNQLQMRELEERLKQIPRLRTELAGERTEKQSLKMKLRELEEKLQKSEQNIRVQLDDSTSPSPVQRSSLKSSIPIKGFEESLSTKLFSTQRVCATSLESLNFRFNNDSSPTFSIVSLGSMHSNGNANQKSFRSLKDSGCMTNASITRDVGTGTINQVLPKTRSTTTNTAAKYSINETELFTEQDVCARIAIAIATSKREEASQKPTECLYTEAELRSGIEQAVQRHEAELTKKRLQNRSTVGVQCTPAATQTRHMGTITDRSKTPPSPPSCIQHSVGVMAVVDTRNMYCMAKPETKSVSLDNMAVSIKFRSTGTNPIAHLAEAPAERRSVSMDRTGGSISLKLLDMMGSTGSLPDDKDHTDAAKAIGVDVSVQCSLLLPNEVVFSPPLVQQHSVAVQHSPRKVHKYSQCLPQKNKSPMSLLPAETPPTVKKNYRTESTDTRDLIRYQDSCNNTDASPKKRDRLTNTDRICTVNEATNTVTHKTIDHGTNPDPPQQTVVLKQEPFVTMTNTACGTDDAQLTKNCTTCLAKIEIKQQTTIKNPNKLEEVQHIDSSRIPRPTALISPRAERKFTRQNTYTISPTTTTSFTHEVEESNSESAITVARVEDEANTTEPTPNDAFISELIAETVNQHNQCLAENLMRISSASREGSPIKHRNPIESGETSRASAEPVQSTAAQSSANGTSQRPTQRNNESRPSSSTTISHPSTSKPRQKTKPTKEMQAALKVINDALQKSNQLSTNLRNANKIVQHEWFRISSTETAQPLDVEDYLDYFEECSTNLLKYVVNLSDANGNTAMHYAISHGNFDVVSILLDSKVCCVNQTNNAGYTCVMLVSLAKLVSAEHHTVVQRLFEMSDVNIRAKKHNQTALMLAVSHGNYDMVQMLLAAGADINIQDEDGSTALMCAAEHGRIDIIKLLLAQPDCDSTIQDVDGSSALKISLEAGYRDIGVLLYAHEHMSRNRSPYGSLRRSSRGRKMSASSGGGGNSGSGPSASDPKC